ncbi:carbonic anhydrase [Azospirillum sp. SYSU D00513]|uniref:carbonic anhydrase n=1 Tax=Azospirillum sp. SYSU D00513 TaxID=2812561 RepID=UPI001A959DDC|nr:carbonic anhydrase [Azospirillum sp. SYSU D00513]
MDAHGKGCLCHGTTAPRSRRDILKLAAVGGGAALLGTAPGRDARAAGAVEALLLSCMDYRLVDDVTRYMDQRGLTNNYDHVILAGASLGAMTEKKAAWNDTFWDHVAVAKQLHQIRKIILMDHRDCGAYRVFLGTDLKDDPIKEAAVHGEILAALANRIRERHADLEVELLLMSLDGTVQKLG